jgi:hypothetical protein
VKDQGRAEAECLTADAATMDIVEMVLTGRVNKGLVSLIQMAGGQAVGLCGKDSSLLTARQMVEKDIGFVGEVTKVNNALLQSLVQADFIPVVSTVAVDAKTGQALNVNADTAAGEIAAALQVQTSPAHAGFAKASSRAPLAVTSYLAAVSRTHYASTVLHSIHCSTLGATFAIPEHDIATFRFTCSAVAGMQCWQR